VVFTNHIWAVGNPNSPDVIGNENDHSRIPGNEKTPPGMNSLVGMIGQKKWSWEVWTVLHTRWASALSYWRTKLLSAVCLVATVLTFC